MGIYASLAKGFQQEYSEVSSEVISTKTSVDSLEREALQIGFWSLKGPKKINQAKSIQSRVERFKGIVDRINREASDMESSGKTTMEENDFLLFESLNKQAGQINTVIIGIEKKVESIREHISDANLWAALYDVFDEIRSAITSTSIRLFKIAKRAAIAAAKETSKRLPPSAKSSIGAFFSRAIGLLPGR